MKIKNKRNVYLGDFQSESGQGMDNSGTVQIPENNMDRPQLLLSTTDEPYSTPVIDEGFDSTIDHVADKVSDDISTHSENDTHVVTAMTARAGDEALVTVSTESAVVAKEPMSTNKKVAIGAVALIGAYFLMKE